MTPTPSTQCKVIMEMVLQIGYWAFRELYKKVSWSVIMILLLLLKMGMEMEMQ